MTFQVKINDFWTKENKQEVLDNIFDLLIIPQKLLIEMSKTAQEKKSSMIAVNFNIHEENVQNRPQISC
jgi:hypothetical protein